MIVKIKSNVPYLTEINGDYIIDGKITVRDFLKEQGVKWDFDALAILNGEYSKGTEILKNKDTIQLLIPLSGG